MSEVHSGSVRIDGVQVLLGEGARRFEALNQVSLSVQAGEFVCLLGPSGCGKSTLLGLLAGHLKPSQGRVTVDNEAINGPAPDRGLVFQQHTLFPWKTVLDNVTFGLKMKGLAKAERNRLALDLLAQVGLRGFEQAYPSQLSGGMQQRVEIARVLINQPRLLLMDEPFGALDAQTRLSMQSLLLEVWSRIRTTVVFVTHDIDEALFLADRVVVMSARPGRIVEQLTVPFARPRRLDITTDPAFVALKRQCLQVLHPAEGIELPESEQLIAAG
ncbi:MAG TPA: ABC transporter ATP-binding protein [Dongiaceae bacterium]|nr:ABC transporter ATP-binding protein [Dongiaceae bacterium]